MAVNDPISDMLVRIRNAYMCGKAKLDVPFSRMKGEISRILKREGYVSDFVVEGGGTDRVLRLYLKYVGENEPAIRGLKRVSKSGCRHYVGARDLPRVLGGMGVAILSTSQGVVTDGEARKRNVGGEVLCHVW